MRRFLGIAALLLGVAALVFVGLAPGIAERGMNKVVPVATPASPRAVALARGFVDLHADTLLWKRDLTKRAGRGQVDLPRLAQGDVALQVFSSVTQVPKGQNYDSNPGDTDVLPWLVAAQGQPLRTWFSPYQRSLWHAEKLRRVAAADPRLRIVRTPGDLDALRSGTVGAMLSVEGLQDIEGSLAKLDALHTAGFRMAGLTHFFDNDVAGSMHGERKGGLTPFGLTVVRRMEALGMIVDVAHASHAAVADVIRLARRPVVSSHGGVQATCRVNRNLTDTEVRGIAGTGGVVGIGYWDAAVCGTSPARIAAAIAHVRDVAGIGHVALGSDFDGAVTTGFDTTRLAGIVQALLDRGFSDAEVEAVIHGNALRVIRAGIAPQPGAR